MPGRRSWPVLWAGAGVVIAVAIIGFSTWMLRDMMRPPASETAAQLAGRSSLVDAVVQVQSMGADGSLGSVLLSAQPDGSYIRTSTALHIERFGEARIVMGNTSDLRAGAVIGLHGARLSSQPLSVGAERIVILTRYAKVR